MVHHKNLGFLGTYLVETLRNEHENDFDPRIFKGTLCTDEPSNPIPIPCKECFKVII
jgi:hypothetical protein